jgi:CBS domain-containing protein
MKIENVMSRDVVACSIDDTLDVAVGLMWDRDHGAVPVVDGDGRVVGIVTDRDACMAAYTQALPLHEIPVTTAMADAVHTLRADDMLVDAERVMTEQQVHRIPIVDGEDRLVGMVSLADLIREVNRPGHVANGAMDVVATLGAVLRPRHVASGPGA